MMRNFAKSNIRGLMIAAGLLSLMGCGKTAVDDTTVQQPNTTIETTIDDPAVDVPVVELVTDVSGNEVEPVEEHDFSDATFVQTGDNSYTIYVDVADNSADAIVPDLWSNFKGTAEGFGISENLLIAVMSHGMQTNPSCPTEINYNVWEDEKINMNVFGLGSCYCELMDDPSTCVWGISKADLEYNGDKETFQTHVNTCAYYLQDCLTHTNGNITLALARYHMGPDAFDAEMQRFKDEKGLTDDEIYAHFNAADVLSSSEQGLEAANYATEVLSYITPEDEIVITTFNSNGQAVATNTYVVTIPKKYGSI